jgi:FlgD Ig-like domain
MKNPGISILTSLLLISIATLVSGVSTAQTPVDGVLSLTPVGEHSCIAAEIQLTAAQPLTGLRWYNNDASAPFSRLLIMEGQVNTPPDVTQTGLVLEVIEGASLAWGDVTFSAPITSSTGTVHAVFELPAFQERTGEGQGGGSGVGYAAATVANGYLSYDGFTWVRLGTDVRLSVEGVSAMGKGIAAAQSLGDQSQTKPDGWWSTPPEPAERQDEEDALAETNGGSPGAATAQRPLVVAPNPFNPRTQVMLYLTEPEAVAVSVYDLRGHLVKQLVRESLSAGQHAFTWEGDDGRHRPVASGVYFISMVTPTQEHRQRVALVR